MSRGYNPYYRYGQRELFREDDYKAPWIEQGFKAAYKSRRPYYIQNIDGNNVMFIPGTRHLSFDWPKNVRDLTPFKSFRRGRVRALDQAVARHNVKLVLGHSRGGALAADMRYGKRSGNTRYAAYDGALSIARKSGKGILNVQQKGNVFDRAIGISGRNNVRVQGGSFHKAFSRK